MPKPSQIKVKSSKGMEGSFISTQALIEKKIILNVLDFEIRDSRVNKSSKLCTLQLKINGRSMITWNGSTSMMKFLQQCKEAEANGQVCFPIEDCIIIEQSNGAYGFQDADETCITPTADELDRLSNQRRTRRNNKTQW